MHPILFWTIGGLSLLASLAVFMARRPVQALVGLLVVLFLDAGLLAGLGAPLVAVELLVVVVGAGLVVWRLVLRPGLFRLGVPGRTRLDVSRLLAAAVVVYLLAVLAGAVARNPDAEPEPWAALTAGFGAWAALVLLGGAGVTAFVVVDTWRRRAPREGESP